jgi:hypothetical protein
MFAVLDWLKNVDQWMVWVAAGLVSGGIVWHKGVMPLVRAIRQIVAWGVRVETALDYTTKEMRFNGGASARDSLNRLERRMIHLEKSLGVITVEQALELIRNLDHIELESRLDHHD